MSDEDGDSSSAVSTAVSVNLADVIQQVKAKFRGPDCGHQPARESAGVALLSEKVWPFGQLFVSCLRP